MPYLVTTTTPVDVADFNDPLPVETRRAVATLDEAQEYVASEIGRVHFAAESPGVDYDPDHFTPSERADANATVSESGGTVGPLPDGTLIDVEFCDRFWLLSEMGRDEHSADTLAEIVDAFNGVFG